mgnify:CR=1 FL=1
MGVKGSGGVFAPLPGTMTGRPASAPVFGVLAVLAAQLARICLGGRQSVRALLVVLAMLGGGESVRALVVVLVLPPAPVAHLASMVGERAEFSSWMHMSFEPKWLRA